MSPRVTGQLGRAVLKTVTVPAAVASGPPLQTLLQPRPHRPVPSFMERSFSSLRGLPRRLPGDCVTSPNLRPWSG